MKSLKVKTKKGAVKRFKLDMVEPPLKKTDYVVFFAVAIVCFVLFQIEDITLKKFIWDLFLPFVVYLICGLLVYKTADELGMGSGKAKICAYAYLTMPIGFYSQFILWQVADIFTVAFVLLGFYFWLKGKDLLFVLLFGMTGIFNSLAILIFVPLLFLKEKNIWRIFGSLFISVLPTLIKAIVYLINNRAETYTRGFLGTGYEAAGIMTGMTDISVAVLLCIIVAAYAYFKNITLKEERVKWAVYLIGLMMFAVFGLGRWEPEWLLVMAPFMTLGAFIHSDTKFFIALELALMLCLEGIFVLEDINIVLSVYVVLLLIMAVFKHPTYSPGGFKHAVDKDTMSFIRVRFIGGVSVSVVPAAISLVKDILF